MAYKKGAGAAAVAGYGAATRNVTAKAKMWEGIESLWGSAQDIGTSVALKKQEADTAWGEYEAGYKAMGGEGFERPKFGEEGYFKGPEGDVRIGDTLYDRSKIQKAGAFLGTDTATVLFAGEGGDNLRDQYIKRTVPGRDVSKMQMPTQAGATAQASGVVPTTPQFPTQDYNQNVVQEQQGMRKGWLESLQLKQTMGSGSDRGFAHGDEEYKKRNLLESLYENNRNRKVY